ncbi:MBL fold metallo-hydrolase [Ruegeria jejuensis]|uniref:MBL fold metallo-hydrolase n=1 Tax=Ruegeria jejuensis TaxID=3233338 RepID=UPI00355BB6B7
MAQETQQIGQYSITRLFDGTFEAPLSVIMHQKGKVACSKAVARWGAPKLSIPVNCFLVRGPGKIMLIDAGAGTGWGPDFGKMRPQLAELGVSPEQIETVLLTHFHGDHALGLMDAGGGAYFPQARVIAPEMDLRFYSDPLERDRAPKARRSGFDIVAQVASAYDDRLAATPVGELIPGLALVSLPGHTPGHCGYQFASANESLLLWGDALHVGALQAPDPDVGLVYDYDGVQAAKTRHTILEALAGSDTFVAGGHLDGFLRVERAGAGYLISKP